MVIRHWSAQTTHAQAPAYADHLRNQVLPTVKKIDGYAGAMLLQREAAEEVEIIVTTLWQSLDSIREFAGAELEEAVVSDEAVSLLTQLNQRGKHYELMIKDEV